MRRRVLLASLMAGCLAAVGALVGVVAAQSAYAATTQQTFLTFYGWWDNTPPGAGISFPKIHKTAGGKGTFADPITFATATQELKPGTKVWVPRVKKYFIMEDSCEECTADWNGHGPDGGPKLRHIDLWIDGKGGPPHRPDQSPTVALRGAGSSPGTPPNTERQRDSVRCGETGQDPGLAV